MTYFIAWIKRKLTIGFIPHFGGFLYFQQIFPTRSTSSTSAHCASRSLRTIQKWTESIYLLSVKCSIVFYSNRLPVRTQGDNWHTDHEPGGIGDFSQVRFLISNRLALRQIASMETQGWTGFADQLNYVQTAEYEPQNISTCPREALKISTSRMILLRM